MGLTMKSFFPKTIKQLQKIAPLVAVIAVSCINCSITAKNAADILHSGMFILASVAVLHVTGFALGYFLATALKFPLESRITISIEVCPLSASKRQHLRDGCGIGRHAEFWFGCCVGYEASW